jgi:xanthine dehydrogenase YagS FAD-binding subunit
MKSFEYAAPRTLEEASALLAERWGETEILAGGTDLVTSLKQHLTAPKRLVSLRNIAGLKGIAVERETVSIGAMCTLAELAADETVKAHFPALTSAIEGIGSRQIISVGTAGGDLCQRPRCWYYRNGFGLFGTKDGNSLVTDGDNRYHAIFGNDGAAKFVSPSSLGPALICLGATIGVVGRDGKKRDLAAGEFFRTPTAEDERETALAPGEILVEIRVPMQGLRNATYEVRHRHGFDWPYVTASVAFQANAGTASKASVVLGHVAPVPWVAAGAEKALNWSKIDKTVAARSGQASVAGAKPLSRNGYKVQLVTTAVKRAVLSAAGMKAEV